MPRCYFCSKPVDTGDFCYGCQTFICERCDEVEPCGAHEVLDHKEDPDELS
jgi:hypothetical protein